MAPRVPPSYVNVFMGAFDDSFVWSRIPIPAVYLRYIGDVFLIWNEAEYLKIYLGLLYNCNKLTKRHREKEWP